MVETLILEYNGKIIELLNSTVTSESLVFENPQWKIQITQRDAISFQMNITHRDESNPGDSFNYQCCCLIEKTSVFILGIYDPYTGKETRLTEMPAFFKPAVNAIFRQLQEELLHPFKDKDYLKSFIQTLID